MKTILCKFEIFFHCMEKRLQGTLKQFWWTEAKRSHPPSNLSSPAKPKLWLAHIGHDSPVDRARELFKPSKMWKVDSFDQKNWELLALNVFWFDVTTVGDQRLFGWCHRGLRKKKCKWQFPCFIFNINEAKIRIFRALDWPSSVSGWQVM